MGKTATFQRGANPWAIECDYAFPSATQNEISGGDAQTLVKNGCKGVFEGANMPSSPEAIEVFQQSGTIFAPGKAANAGNVAVSGLEMSQNAQMINWERDVVETKLLNIMTKIHEQCCSAGSRRLILPIELEWRGTALPACVSIPLNAALLILDVNSFQADVCNTLKSGFEISGIIFPEREF